MTTELQSEKRFEKIIAILIALTAVFTAATTFLEGVASNEADRYNRLAQDYSIRATTESLNGAIQFSYDWQGAFQTWHELDLMITNAEQFGDTERAERARQTRDALANLTPLLQTPYYDPAIQWTDPYKYEADIYLVEATALWEEYENKSTVANKWEQMASAFVVQITLYAVALSLYGLSTTISNFTRWLFIAIGSFIVLINSIWGGLMFLTDVHEIPAPAIQAYSEGVGLAYQALDREAIAKFDQALSEEPGYASALYNRGFSRLNIGDYDGAAADLEATLNAGKIDTSVLWNLGWTYYLSGRYDEAVAVNQQALALDPTLVAVRTNQGLVLLAQGRPLNAATEYDLALQEAARQVTDARAVGEEVPSSLWYYMDAAVLDLQSLVASLNPNVTAFGDAPQASLITGNPADIRRQSAQLIEQFREYTVSLEFSSAPPEETAQVQVSEFSFVQEVYDDQGNFVEYVDSEVNEYGVDEIGILFDFSGFRDGQHEVWKIYVNGYEDTALRVVSTWEVGESGSAIKFISYAFSNVFVFGSGEYTVELYIDHQLVQKGTFYVLAP